MSLENIGGASASGTPHRIAVRPSSRRSGAGWCAPRVVSIRAIHSQAVTTMSRPA